MYKIIQTKITACDIEIEKMLSKIIHQDDNKRQHYIGKKSHKRINKNTPKNIDLNIVGYQYFEGVDLMEIEGFSHGTILHLISEVGLEGIKKFQTAKQFASWLRLAPNNKKTGGKIQSEDNNDDHDPEKPVGRPESCFFHFIPLLRTRSQVRIVSRKRISPIP